MGVFFSIADFILHIDQHLTAMTSTYGLFIYLILFGIIFIETGVVVFPFLPGDSLLFAAGAIAALQSSKLSFGLLFLTVSSAAIIGDSANYLIGDLLGELILTKGRMKRLINGEKIAKAQHFFDTYGGKTIFFGRFIPFIRTFVPFIAGASKMKYYHFLLFNILGAICWTVLGLGAGFFFGNIPLIQAHFSLVVLLIVAISLVPVLTSSLRKKQTPVKEEGK